MKIIQFMASQSWGGAEKVFVEISNELSERHDIIVILLRDTEYKGKFIKKVGIVELTSHPTRHNPFLLWELYRVIKRIKADVLHTHAAKASELIYTIHRLLKVKHLGTKHNARKGRIFNKLKWVSVVSEEAKESVQLRRDGIVKIINNGIIPEKTSCFKKNKNEFFRIVAIGRLDKIKGFDVLIDQVTELPFPFNLSIVGEGGEARNLQAKIDNSGMNDSISLEGFSEDIPSLMQNSDLIVISSHSEGFPKVMVESLFYGNVLVSTPVGGVREVIPPLFLAELDQFGDKIKDIKKNYSYYFEQFEKLKKSRADSFTIDKIVCKYESMYSDMLS